MITVDSHGVATVRAYEFILVFSYDGSPWATFGVLSEYTLAGALKRRSELLNDFHMIHPNADYAWRELSK